jgi:hypothetical protein
VTTSVACDLGGPQTQAPVVDEQRIADGHVAGQRGQGGADDLSRAGHVPVGDREGCALDELGLPFGEVAHPDLRALQVEQHRHRTAGVEGCLTDPGELLFVFVPGAVAEVESGDVDALVDEFSDLLVGVLVRT